LTRPPQATTTATRPSQTDTRTPRSWPRAHVSVQVA
jgi:hypothetical protein